MGLDYVVDLDCAPKRALGGAEGVVDLVKCRSRADAVLSMSRQRGDSRPPSQITFKVAVQRPTGVETSDVSVQALLDQASALEPHRSACVACPANGGRPEGFGCYQSLSYPIEARTEQWLWSRLPPNTDCTAGHLLMKAASDFGWDGAQASGLRRQGRTFFESPQPLHARYPSGFTFTSDQLFHMILHVGHLGSSHCLMLVLFLGVLRHEVDPQIFADVQRRAQMLALTNVPEMEGQIEQAASLLRALVMAARLDVDLLIDG